MAPRGFLREPQKPARHASWRVNRLPKLKLHFRFRSSQPGSSGAARREGTGRNHYAHNAQIERVVRLTVESTPGDEPGGTGGGEVQMKARHRFQGAFCRIHGAAMHDRRAGRLSALRFALPAATSTAARVMRLAPYWCPRIHADLLADGGRVGRKRIARLRDAGGSAEYADASGSQMRERAPRGQRRTCSNATWSPG
jgi:hypothetical protein